jgi:hypothetical protein
MLITCQAVPVKILESVRSDAGRTAVTTPAVPLLFQQAHARFGRLPWRDPLTPAISRVGNGASGTVGINGAQPLLNEGPIYFTEMGFRWC